MMVLGDFGLNKKQSCWFTKRLGSVVVAWTSRGPCSSSQKVFRVRIPCWGHASTGGPVCAVHLARCESHHSGSDSEVGRKLGSTYSLI